MGNLIGRLGKNKKSSTRYGINVGNAERKIKSLPEFNGGVGKYSCIPDNFSSIDEVAFALREAGLESSNLIVGIDFTKSNEWTGRTSFNFQCLHKISDRQNPYEQAIRIIGKTLAPFDEDNLIPCFGFGDATTKDEGVFSFHEDHSPCFGFEEVLTCYRRIAPNLQLSGPTSFAPIVDAAVDIVEKTGGQFHVLVILADGQITKSNEYGTLSKQEVKTIESIVTASSHPLAIILVGIGDGPWEGMTTFDNELPQRAFDNFQFVNFTDTMSNKENHEAAFALAALMEIPDQYRACVELHLLGKRIGRPRKAVPLPPPMYSRHQLSPSPSDLDYPAYHQGEVCPLCFANVKSGWGHVVGCSNARSY
ncbi:hypothetical protein Scep_013373 [Stephania cephalantha]|uniref:Copine C-terminal domain-containing protein n=1 Tax=Stephania cephalantha TaxID=152367 RepID=A0AAP0JJ09_9MAGN